ncbi:MAG: anion transporter, partial [Chloroflexi bacterium]|nr:anion transporter [Chloroflexota bacterium]
MPSAVIPIPYLIGLATAANIGSAATITGNSQNMLIGLTAPIAFVEFSRALVPVALLGLVIAWGILLWLYRTEFAPRTLPPTAAMPTPSDPWLLKKSLALIGL